MGSKSRRDSRGKPDDDPDECITWIEAIIHGSPIPQFVISKDHHILYWNEALEKYSGIKSKEVIGTNQHWRAFYTHERPCMADLLVEGEEERIPELYDRKYKKSSLIDGAYEATDYFQLMGRTGSWLYFTAAPIRDKKGRIIGAIETLEDITGRKNAEVELKKSREKYHRVFELDRDAILLYTPETKNAPGRFIEANEVASRMLGYSMEKLLTMGLYDIIAPGMHSQIKSTVRSAEKKGQVIFETKFLRENKKEIPVEATTHIVDFYDKKLWIFHVRDISERIKMEDSLKESEYRFMDLFNSMKSGVAVYRPVNDGEDFEFVDFNRGAENIEHIRKEDVIGRRVTDVFPGIREFGLLEVFQTVWSTGKPMSHPISQYRDERIQSWRENYVYRLPSGEIVALYDDVTDNKKAEEALIESEKKYRNLVENISDVILTIDLKGKITYINPVVENIYGYTPDEVLGSNFMDFVHPDDLPQAREILEKRTAGEQSDNVFRVFAKNGTERYARTTQTLLFHARDLAGFSFIITDFTERKKAEDALSLANKKLNMLSSITRHDILNSIMAVTGYLEMSKDIADNPELRKYIDKEIEAVSSIQRQIEFTRQYQDIGVNEPGWQDIAGISDQAAGSLELDGIEYKNSLEGIEIFCDPLVEKVFYNLMENSLRHGENVTEISLSYVIDGDTILISYRDNGVGITDKDREKLFRKGFGKHTGLGLFLSREILSITGIEITENGKEGRGVNFEMRVPKGGYRFKDETPA